MTPPGGTSAGHDKPWTRAVLHVDMDAFYASVEQRDDPKLLGKPVIVGGSGRRGVVSACSYEARRYGVKSAMPMFAAQRLCPQAVCVPVRMGRYVAVSKDVMAIFARFSPLVEPLSLDEAFIDITGTEALFGPPVDVAWKIQRAVKEELSLSCSVGVAASKFVAKVASDLKKPHGLVVVPPGGEEAFLHPLEVERLWGVGPKTAERLKGLGLSTIGDIFRQGEATLQQLLGNLGPHLWRLAAAHDDRPVDPERERKSIGAERTLEKDISGEAAVLRELLSLVDEVAAALRAADRQAGGVRLKLKYADFRSVTRELKLPQPRSDAASLRQALETLVQRADTDRPMRLVGVAATSLTELGAPVQRGLFDAPVEEAQEKHDTLGHTLDRIHERFGKAALSRGDHHAEDCPKPRGRDDRAPLLASEIAARLKAKRAADQTEAPPGHDELLDDAPDDVFDVDDPGPA